MTHFCLKNGQNVTKLLQMAVCLQLVGRGIFEIGTCLTEGNYYTVREDVHDVMLSELK